jgi:hypothetical protein
VYRESIDQWVITRQYVYACNNGEMHQGGETQTLQVKPGGTFVGIDIKPRSPCPGGPLVTPLAATRVGDLPADAEVADPNTV